MCDCEDLVYEYVFCKRANKKLKVYANYSCCSYFQKNPFEALF